MIEFRKGTMGWAVIRDGKPVGTIKSAHGVYLVSVDGFRPGVDPATKGKHTFPTLGDAKAKAKQVLG